MSCFENELYNAKNNKCKIVLKYLFDTLKIRVILFKNFI